MSLRNCLLGVIAVLASSCVVQADPIQGQRGADGAPGPKGPPGDTGPPGVTTVTIDGGAMSIQELADVVAAQQQAIEALQAQSPPRTRVCGWTLPAPMGDLGTDAGYVGAKVLCEMADQCNKSPTAHMCTSDEVALSAQMGITITGTTSWYSSGMRVDIAAGSLNDCKGWTSTSSTDLGPVWNTEGKPDFAQCNKFAHVLCCDEVAP